MSRDPRKDRRAKRRRRRRFESWDRRTLPTRICAAIYPTDLLHHVAHSFFPAGLKLPGRPSGLNR